MGRAGRPDRTRPAATSPLLPQVEPVAVPARPGTESATTLGAPSSRTPEAPESGTTGVPKYLTLERKDARLRTDQVEHLTQLARALAGRRVERGERITDNTLIRVAVDLLLTYADDLHGDTEEQLRESVSAVVREVRS